MIKQMSVVVVGLGLSLAINAQQTCQVDNIVATAPDSRYMVHAGGTVTDTRTGLMWQVCLVGQSGDRCTEGSPGNFSWAAALLYPGKSNQQADLGGYNDWRLPNIRELSTLAELQCARPAINLSVFPNTPPSHLWSSSPYQFYPHYSWYMDFEEGIYTYGERIDSEKHIRLVRTAGR